MPLSLVPQDGFHFRSAFTSPDPREELSQEEKLQKPLWEEKWDRGALIPKSKRDGGGALSEKRQHVQGSLRLLFHSSLTLLCSGLGNLEYIERQNRVTLALGILFELMWLSVDFERNTVPTTWPLRHPPLRTEESFSVIILILLSQHVL